MRFAGGASSIRFYCFLVHCMQGDTISVLLDCNLFEINISYGFRNIKAICQQPSAQLIVTLISRISMVTNRKRFYCTGSGRGRKDGVMRFVCTR